MQSHRAQVVAEALPRPDGIRARGSGQVGHRRETRQPGVPLRNHPIDLCLLEHDLGDEHRVGIARAPPGQIALLLQIAVLRQDSPNGAFYTGELRIEELLTWLRGRYGLHIDRLPRGDGFSAPTIDDRAALRVNAAAFTQRLREVGFYRDLSDAYVSQTVTPRYRILPPTGAGGGVA